MRTQANSSSKSNINEYNNSNSVIYTVKPQLYSGFDKLENKGHHVNSFNFNKIPRKLEKLDAINNSYATASLEDKRSSPLRSAYLKTEPQKDSGTSGLKRSTRLNTGESEKAGRLETSFDGAYLDKYKVLNEPKRRMIAAPYHNRVYSHNRVTRNPPIREYNNITRTGDESAIEIRRKRFYQNISEKRPSAQIEKNSMDNSLPAIYLNGNEKYQKGKVPAIKAANLYSEQNAMNTIESPNIVQKSIRKEYAGGSNRMTKMPSIKDDSKQFRSRLKHGDSLSPARDSFGENFTTLSNLKSTNSLITSSNHGGSPPKHIRSNSRDLGNSDLIKGNSNIFNAIQSSMDPNKRGNNSLLIDHGFDKVNELTNKNNIARYDLLKIQESALELKMRLVSKKPLQKSMNRTNQTFADDLASYGTSIPTEP